MKGGVHGPISALNRQQRTSAESPAHRPGWALGSPPGSEPPGPHTGPLALKTIQQSLGQTTHSTTTRPLLTHSFNYQQASRAPRRPTTKSVLQKGPPWGTQADSHTDEWTRSLRSPSSTGRDRCWNSQGGLPRGSCCPPTSTGLGFWATRAPGQSATPQSRISLKTAKPEQLL